MWFVRRVKEGLEEFDRVGEVFRVGLGVGLVEVLREVLGVLVEMDGVEERVDWLGGDVGVELVREVLEGVEIVVLSEDVVRLEVGDRGLDNEIGLKVE